MEIEQTGKIIVNGAIKVHKALGPGLLESVYQKCFEYELMKVGLAVNCEVPLPINYEEIESEWVISLHFNDDAQPSRRQAGRHFQIVRSDLKIVPYPYTLGVFATLRFHRFPRPQESKKSNQLNREVNLCLSVSNLNYC